jgi:hypothetical protein
MSRRVDSGLARFGLPGLALGIVIAWCANFRGEPAAAEQTQGVSARSASPGSGGSNRPEAAKPQSAKTVAGNDPAGTMALITNSTGPVQWLYLIDTKQKSFAIYRIDPNNPKGSVKLEASRKYRWDLELDEYNNQGLEPSDVEARVKALAHTTQ